MRTITPLLELSCLLVSSGCAVAIHTEAHRHLQWCRPLHRPRCRVQRCNAFAITHRRIHHTTCHRWTRLGTPYETACKLFACVCTPEADNTSTATLVSCVALASMGGAFSSAMVEGRKVTLDCLVREANSARKLVLWTHPKKSCIQISFLIQYTSPYHHCLRNIHIFYQRELVYFPNEEKAQVPDRNVATPFTRCSPIAFFLDVQSTAPAAGSKACSPLSTMM